MHSCSSDDLVRKFVQVGEVTDKSEKTFTWVSFADLGFRPPVDCATYSRRRKAARKKEYQRREFFCTLTCFTKYLSLGLSSILQSLELERGLEYE